MSNSITWIIHSVCDGVQIAAHTHGLNQYGSLELELNIAIPSHKIMEILNVIGLHIAQGHHYQSGDCDTELFNLPFYLLETAPIFGDNRSEDAILRVILPDASGLYPWHTRCSEGYRDQISATEVALMRKELSKYD